MTSSTRSAVKPAQIIKDAAVAAQSSAITTSMIVLAGIALAGAIFAWFVIGRRRTPTTSR